MKNYSHSHLSALVMLAISALISGVAQAADVSVKCTVFVNYDSTHFGHSRAKNGIVPDEAHIRQHVRQYQGTDVTDLLFDIGGRLASVNNSVMESMADKVVWAKKNGKKLDDAGICELYHDLEVRKLDRFALWFDEARKIGIHPWMSFRMNDCHCCFEPDSWINPSDFFDHPERWRVRHRDYSLGYFDRCLDYAQEAVREQRLAFIAEMLDRYDVDGVELDWMREIYCFQPGREDASAIEYVTRRVRALTQKAALRLGHPVRVSARVPTDPETALRFGFDVAKWADEKLVDVVSPCPRWETSETDVPVDLWKRLLRGTGVQLLPGVELLMKTGLTQLYQTTEQIMGEAAWFYTAGADGIYFFNYFDDPAWDKGADKVYWGDRQPLANMGVWWGNQRKWLMFIGRPESVLAAPRDHVLTFRDIGTLYRGESAPFQCMVEKDQVKFYRLATGKVAKGRKLTLRIGAWGKVAPARVFVNSRPCRFVREEKCVPAFTESPLYCYEVPELPEESALVEIIPDRKTELTFLDLQVR